MDNDRERIHHLAVDANVQFNQMLRTKVQKFIIERGISARHRLQTVVKVEDYLRQRHLVMKDDALMTGVAEVALRAAALLAQTHNSPEVLFGYVDRSEDE